MTTDTAHILAMPAEPARKAMCEWLTRHGIDYRRVPVPSSITRHLHPDPPGITYSRYVVDETGRRQVNEARDAVLVEEMFLLTDADPEPFPPGIASVPAPTAPAPRPVYADPDESTEGWDEEHDRPIHDSAGWDLSWGCAVTISHQHAYDGDPERWTATVALSDEDARKGIVVREVTPEQVRAYAAHLLALVDRHAPVSTAPDEVS